MKPCSVIVLALTLVSVVLHSELTSADSGFLENGGGNGEKRLLAEEPVKKFVTKEEATKLQSVWYKLNVGKQDKTDAPPAPTLFIVKAGEGDAPIVLYAQANASGIEALAENERTAGGLEAYIKKAIEKSAEAHYGYEDTKTAVKTTNEDIKETAQYKEIENDGGFTEALNAMMATISGVFGIVPKFLVLTGAMVTAAVGLLW